jgi:hypothetical protein
MADKSYFKLAGKMYTINVENNRAMFGDVVVLQLNDRKAWKSKFKQL